MRKGLSSFLVGAIGLGAYVALRKSSPAQPYSFRDQTVVITGGSRGLGLLLAQEFALEGANLVIMARDAHELELAAQKLRDLGAEVYTVCGNIGDEQHAQQLIEKSMMAFDHIDVLINNAGVIKAGPVEHMTAADWQEAIAVHVYGPLYTMLAVRPYMQAQGGGRIVNIASIGGKIAVPHLLPYCTSKFALVGLSDGMRVELAKDNILVTTVCPGLMRTGSHTEALFKGQHEQEYTLFSMLDTSPVTSVDARHAAHQIVEACRKGSPALTISLQAQVATLMHNLFPDLSDQTLKVANQFLPKASNSAGDITRVGWEIQAEYDI